MAVFPSLNPSSSRTFSSGDYPHTVYTGLSGDESRVRHSSVMTGSEVRLSFSGLSESDMLSILSHYQGQVGAYYAFTLPSISFAGMADATVFTLSRYQWRYQAAPVVRDLPCGTHTVDVQLVSVAPEPVATQGARLVVVASLALTPVVTTSGLSATITASIEYGAAETIGLAQTVTATLTAGAATGNTEALGAIFIVPLLLLGGTAAAANGLDRAITVSIAGGTATGGSSQTGSSQTVTVSLAGGAAFTSTQLSALLHFDGSNNSTTFTDSSPNATTFTANGNAKISTTQSKFGGASAYFDGTRDFLTAPASALWDLSSGDFTLEFWFYKTADKTSTYISQGEATTWRVQSTDDGKLVWVTTTTQSAVQAAGRITSGIISLNAWHHLAIVRSGSTITMYVDGVSAGTTTSTLGSLSNQVLYIGQNPNGSLSGSQWSFEGYIDELRLIKTAIYTANFTPPTAAFPNP